MARFDTYIICTSPRSGSTLLCKLLSATNVAGNPESYFHKPSIASWLAHLGLSHETTLSEVNTLYLIFNTAKSKGSLNTGIFGDRQRIESEFGDVCFIHLTRLDKVAQAISLLKAEQTGLWHIAADGTELERLSEPQLPTYDAVALNKRVEEVTKYDHCWVTWFRDEKIHPFRITYEELSSDPTGTLVRILTHLGIDGKAAANVEPEVAKMSDRVSHDWAKRYRSDSNSA